MNTFNSSTNRLSTSNNGDIQDQYITSNHNYLQSKLISTPMGKLIYLYQHVLLLQEVGTHVCTATTMHVQNF